MYSYSIYIGLKVLPIQVLWVQSIYYLDDYVDPQGNTECFEEVGIPSLPRKP